jgi:hypothetical protein
MRKEKASRRVLFPSLNISILNVFAADFYADANQIRLLQQCCMSPEENIIEHRSRKKQAVTTVKQSAMSG